MSLPNNAAGDINVGSKYKRFLLFITHAVQKLAKRQFYS